MSISIDLHGKVAVVTGAGRGLGKAIAIGLAQAGAKVALAARSKEQLEEVAHHITKKVKGEAIVLPTDVTVQEEVDLLLNLVPDALGGLHIVVNNAGIERAKPLQEMTESDWDDVMDVNMKSIYRVTKAAGRHLIPQNYGRVLNMASVGGTIASANNSVYHASKAGVILFSKSLALEWARYNITVNCLAPGWFQTEMLDSLMKSEDRKEKFRKAIPIRRFGDPEELGPLAAYLCSDYASYITGQAIIIDGGLSST